jgi:hypothetical protein
VPSDIDVEQSVKGRLDQDRVRDFDAGQAQERRLEGGSLKRSNWQVSVLGAEPELLLVAPELHSSPQPARLDQDAQRERRATDVGSVEPGPAIDVIAVVGDDRLRDLLSGDTAAPVRVRVTNGRRLGLDPGGSRHDRLIRLLEAERRMLSDPSYEL